jgi:hypothetical protein
VEPADRGKAVEDESAADLPLPTGRRYLLALAGAQKRAKSEEGVEVIGRGFGYSADGIRLRKGERNRLVLSRSVRRWCSSTMRSRARRRRSG